MDILDFHTHSYFSDGTLSPNQLIKQAFEDKITQISLTDHDNVLGLKEAEETAENLGIKFIKGIEISSQSKQFPVIHVLGYHLKDFNALNDVINENAESLRERNSRIIKFLQENCDINIDINDFYNFFKGTIGKGNLAQYMKYKGYTSSFKEAEDIMRPYKAGSYGVDIKQAIKAIHNAGGKAFLAHPYNLKNDDNLLETLKEFVSYGLDGVECFHTNHSDEQIKLYLDCAQNLNLKISGGTDFHGEFKPLVKLGYGKGDKPLLQNEFISIYE